MDSPLHYTVFFFSLLLIKIFTTTVHEMGHAIIAYIITKKRVSIYLGSYGDEQKSKRIKIAMFDVWLRVNPLKWRGGLCRYSDTPARYEYSITLAGPIASLLLFITLFSVNLVYRPQGLEGAFLLIFCVWAGLVFLYNVAPVNKLVGLQDGNMTYNDGSRLRLLRLNRRMPPDFALAMEHYEAKRYAEATALFEKFIEDGTNNETVYRSSVSANLQLKRYQKAEYILKDQTARIGNLNSIDRINLAVIKMGLGKYDEAIAYFQHLLLTGEGNKYNLCNYGYTLVVAGRPKEAIPHLDKAIEIDRDFHFAYCNRALAKLRLGLLEDGKTDNDRAMSLDPTNAEAYRNEGIYLLEKGQYTDALERLIKAREMDNDSIWVNDYIARANSGIGVTKFSE